MTRRALISSYFPPQIDRDSGSRRMWDLIGVLRAHGWLISFVASQGLGEGGYARLLQRLGIVVYDGSTTPLDEVLAATRFDLAIFGFWPIAEYYMPVVRRVSPDTRVVVDSLDLHFLRDARRIFGGQTSGGVPALLDAEYASQMRGEINTYAAADAVLAVSRKEADLINDIVGEAGLAHMVPDTEPAVTSPRPFRDRKGMVMVGSYQHPPNVQAVAHLCREILPRLPKALAAKHPVYIVGHGLNETVRSFGEGLPNVRMVGWVPSIAPYLESARISVVPLLYGAGTKRKILQALMAGLPVVTTSIGAEGLNLRHGEHALIADDAAEFARAVGELLSDDRLWRRLQSNGQAQIGMLHSLEEASRLFLDVVGRVLERPPKPSLLPEITADDHRLRLMYGHLNQLLPHIYKLLGETVPRGASIAVASDGCPIFGLDGYETRHFMEDEMSRRSDWRSVNAAGIINRLETLRGEGAEFLLIPNPSLWWLDSLGEFREYLDSRYEKLARVDRVCALYRLQAPEVESWWMPEQPSVLEPAGPGEPSAAEQFPPHFKWNESRDVRLIAFYLPQYHPIPENDTWWGEGFTEWRNVVQARPLFVGHYQPQLPADLGYYDLRSGETREAQVALARQYGIFGFCYYHYWFAGKRLLERPFTDVLITGRPDFPFCLCWANEPWSRQWDGRPHDVLQPQPYSEADDLEHIRWLLPALSDPRAIKIAGKPVFLVYQGRELPAPERTIETWRHEANRAGLEGIYLIAVESGWDAGWDATQVGFDAKVLFQPQFSILSTTPRTEIKDKPGMHVHDYAKAWPALANPEPVSYRRYDTVFPAWDNSARKGANGWVVHNSSPAAYEEWLRITIDRARRLPAGERVVFLNAWNEWAEGAHLEPDMQHGHAYLEATRRALRKATRRRVNERQSGHGAQHAD